MEKVNLRIKKNLKNNLLIYKILKLKKTKWQYNLKSQKKWFDLNVKKNDLHLILQKKNEIIGYVLLKEKKINLKNIEKKIFHFDTLIIKKKYRNNNLGKLIIKKANKLIKSKKSWGFLICTKKMTNYYNQFGWRISKNLKIHSIKKKEAMTYNFNLNTKISILLDK